MKASIFLKNNYLKRESWDKQTITCCHSGPVPWSYTFTNISSQLANRLYRSRQECNVTHPTQKLIKQSNKLMISRQRSTWAFKHCFPVMFVSLTGLLRTSFNHDLELTHLKTFKSFFQISTITLKKTRQGQSH